MFTPRGFLSGLLIAVSSTSFALTSSAQSGAWSDQFDRPGLLGRVFAVAELGSDLVAGGLPLEADGQELGLVARFDGQIWRPIGGGIQGSIVRDFAMYQGELVAAGAGGASGRARKERSGPRFPSFSPSPPGARPWSRPLASLEHS